MPYEIKQAWNFFKCVKCGNMITQGSMFLQTSNFSGTYSYCYKCAVEKGYKPLDHDLRQINLHSMPNKLQTSWNLKIDDELLNYFQVT